MKKIALVLAVLFAFAAFSGMVSADSSLEPATYKNVFSAKYGKSEGELNPAYSLADDSGSYMLPTLYSVADDERIYVVDTVNAESKEPIKCYTKDGVYNGTIVSEGRFIDEHTRIIDIKAVGECIWVLNSISELYRYNIDEDKVTKYDLGTMDGFLPYALIYTHEDCLAVAYRPVEFIEDIHFEYKAFSMSEGSSMENAVTVTYTADGNGDRTTEFNWFGTKLSLKSGRYEIPIGKDSLGELVVKQATGDDKPIEYHTFDTETGEHGGTGVVETNNPTRMEGGNLLGAPSFSETPVEEYKIELLHILTDFEGSEYAYTLPVYSITEYEEIDEKYLTARPYGYSLGPDIGPRDFAVTENGDFYVVSYYDTKADMELFRYTKDGKYAETITPGFGGAIAVIPISQLAVCGNNIYTVCRLKDEDGMYDWLYEYDTANKTSELYELPNSFKQGTLITREYSFFTVDNCIVFDNISGLEKGRNGFVFDTKTKKFVSDETVFSYSYDGNSAAYIFKAGDAKYTVRTARAEVYAVAGIDADGNLIAQVGFNTYRRYAKNGEINGVADYDYDTPMLLENNINVYGGKVYKARSTKKEYFIDEMTFNEKFLNENRYDVNLDGKQNTADAAFVLKYTAGMIDLSAKGSQTVKADVDRNGGVSTYDAVKILKYCAGMN